MRIALALTVTAISSASFSVQAAPVQYSDNGHYYELIEFSDIRLQDLLGQLNKTRLDWYEAKDFSETLSHQGLGGHLATLTSQAEDDFVWNNVHTDNELVGEGVFLGAYDNSTQDSQGKWSHNQWQWVTGESFSYSNWLPGEPNHWQDGSDATPNNEDYLMYWWTPDATANANGRWNDTNIDTSWMKGSALSYSGRGFLVEYDLPLPTSTTPVPVPTTAWLFLTGFFAVLAGSKKGNKLVA